MNGLQRFHALVAVLIVSASIVSFCQSSDTRAVHQVSQATSNVATFSSINSILYADLFAGSDIGAKVGAALEALPLRNGRPSGVVELSPAVAYSQSTPIVVHSPYVTIDCNGSTLHFSGSGTQILFDDAPTSYDGDGGLLNCNLAGNSYPTAVGVDIREVTFFRMHDVYIAGFSRGVGALLENTRKWTEQSDWDHVRFLGNYIGIKFADNCIDNRGCSSFSYSRFRNVLVSIPAGGTGVLLANDSRLDTMLNSDFSFFVGNGGVAMHLADSSGIIEGELSIGGEVASEKASATGIQIDAGATLQTVLHESWRHGDVADVTKGNRIVYVFANSTAGPKPNSVALGQIQAVADGVCIKANAGVGCGTLDFSELTGFRHYKVPDSSGQFPVVVAAGVTPLTTAAIPAVTCLRSAENATPGVLASDTVSWSFNAEPGSGWAQLSVHSYVSKGRVAFQICNTSAATVRPAAATVNWKVIR